MALAINKNTQQTPLTSGKTGTQLIKFIPAPRVYIKGSKDSVTVAPVQAYNTKSNGVTPTNGGTWIDLGIVNGNAVITYTKDITEITTGIDQVLRMSYIAKKTAQIEFTLAQVDDYVLEQIMGVTASQLVLGSVYNFQIGSEDIIERALMLVVQNKLDQKEWQFYNPAAQLSFAFADEDNAVVLKGTAKLPAFSVQGAGATDPQGFISSTVFA
jgi:hypothetical protein